MSKHTQGPWEWDGNVWNYDNHQEAPWLVQAPWTALNSQPVLTGSIECKSEADARLIAAAPELLEALKRLVANLNEGDFISITRIEEARDAIAKAEGEA